MESLDDLKRHIGRRSEPAFDIVVPSAMEKLAATVGLEDTDWRKGAPIPPGWHIALFPPLHRPSNMRADGLAKVGALPVSVPLPRRRMGPVRMSFHEPLRIGDEVESVSEIADIRVDENADGTRLTLVDRISIRGPRGLAVVEETDRLWMSERRATARAGVASHGEPSAAWQQVIEATPVLLFRASAAKFNSHRIHYDRDYAMRTEGLPGLAVQSTLLALFMMEMCRREMPGAEMKTFTHQRVRQFYDNGSFTVAGRPEGGKAARCWVVAPEGDVAMTAEAAFG